MTKDEALDLALEALEKSTDNFPANVQHRKAITAIKQARALDKKAENARDLGLDYEPVQDSTCNETLRAQGKAYPRTCRKCGLGPCIGAPKQPPAQPAPVQEPDYAWPTVDDYEKDVGFQVGEAFKMAWNMARTTNGFLKLLSGEAPSPAAQRTWVELSSEDKKIIRNNVGYDQFMTAGEYAHLVQEATEIKLKELNT